MILIRPTAANQRVDVLGVGLQRRIEVGQSLIILRPLAVQLTAFDPRGDVIGLALDLAGE